MSGPRALLWGAVIAFALSARFVFETALVNRLPAALAVCAAVVPAALGVAALSFRLPNRSRMPRRDLILAAVAGVMGVWASPFLVAAMRRTDAPSATEVLFLTSAVWGLLLVASAIVVRRGLRAPVRLVAALLGVTAAAGILGNWERPSSFSPFVKFPAQELVMLLAGAAFVVAAWVLHGLVRRHGPLRAVRPVALSGAVAAVVAALLLEPARLGDLAHADVWTFAAPTAIVTFALLLGWAEAVSSVSPEVVAGAYFLPPALLSALTLLEHATGVFGPDPIRWGAAGPSIALAVLAGAVVSWLPDSEAPPSRPAPRLALAARATAVIAVVAAAVALLTPDILVSVRGQLSTGPEFQTSFAMLGFETAGGWLAACCSLLVLVWAFRPGPRLQQWACAALLALAVVVWVPVHTTPTHTWNSWIPPEVQQDYGTEYAKRVELPVTDRWEMVALGGAVVTAALLLAEARERAYDAPAGQEVLSG